MMSWLKEKFAEIKKKISDRIHDKNFKYYLVSYILRAVIAILFIVFVVKFLYIA